MEDAIEGALVREGAGEVDRDEIDAPIDGKDHERGMDEALLLLGGQGIPYQEPSPRGIPHGK